MDTSIRNILYKWNVFSCLTKMFRKTPNYDNFSSEWCVAYKIVDWPGRGIPRAPRASTLAASVPLAQPEIQAHFMVSSTL